MPVRFAWLSLIGLLSLASCPSCAAAHHASPPDSGITAVTPGAAAAGAPAARDGAAVAFDPCPPRGTPCRILPLGDSITAGAGSTAWGGYRVELFRKARKAGQTITFVGAVRNGPQLVDGALFPRSHEGHSGYTIDDGGGRSGISALVGPALDAVRPHIVTLMIGTNDVDLGLDLPNAPARLGALIDAIQRGAPDALVVLAQIVPTVSATKDADVVAYNAAMPALVAARAAAGKHIVLVDMHAAFEKNPRFATEFMNDGLHPSDAGYAAMAEVWYAALGPLLH
jgi:lysophospholipase L1-like esterase